MSRAVRLRIVLALNLALVTALVMVGIAAHSLGVFAEGADYIGDAAAIGDWRRAHPAPAAHTDTPKPAPGPRSSTPPGSSSSPSWSPPAPSTAWPPASTPSTDSPS
jgi:hypothetical protein